MKPTKEAIRALTPPQRQAIHEVRSAMQYSPKGRAATRVFNHLADRKIVLLKPGHNDLYVIHPDWQYVNVDLPDRERKVYPRQEKVVIPDPPKRMIRPPAIYSNRTREQLIDNILKK